MTKKLFILSLIGLISATSAYAKCDGGTEITNSAGTTFCRSNVRMNWWSAAAWCRANGLHLATMYEMCPSWDGNTGNGKCQELKGVDSQPEHVWSATAAGMHWGFTVNCLYGTVYGINNAERQQDNSRRAFCL